VSASSEVTPKRSSRVLFLDQDGLERLAEAFAGSIVPGDWVALYGNLGAGKTTFARAFIRAFLGDASVDVPSPTYALRQDYQSSRGRVVHCDFYRIANAGELDELGINDTTAVWIAEWPERAEWSISPDRFEVHIATSDTPAARNVTLTGHSSRVAAVVDTYFAMPPAHLGK
jgi:N-acetylmuramate 1-kinase